jgi:uncharacterized protein (TIGR00269 family)
VKCKKCSREAVVKLKHYNLSLCEEHFYEFFEERVKKAIKKFRMFDENDRILVAVSGGKDSMTVWYVLNRLGYRADGLFIRLGNGVSVDKTQEMIRNFADNLGRKMIVEDATKYLYGLSTFEASKILKRPTCSFCGMVKRYLMNKVAVEAGYDVLVTGHNLDDEASQLLGNLIHWQMDYILRSWPVLEKTHEKLAKKAKPLVLNYEDDIKLYAKMKGIPFLEEACPFSLGATSKVYKSLLHELENQQKGAILSFYVGYIREKERVFKLEEKNVELRSCKVCGYPTTAEVCTFCRARENLKKRLEKRKANVKR